MVLVRNTWFQKKACSFPEGIDTKVGKIDYSFKRKQSMSKSSLRKDKAYGDIIGNGEVL